MYISFLNYYFYKKIKSLYVQDLHIAHFMSNKMSFKSDSKIVQCDFLSLCFLFDVFFFFFLQ